MTLTNRELFAKALCEALSREYHEELADCTETSECSMSHYRKMSKILGFSVVPKTKESMFKKRLIIAVLAATLLLAGCTAAIFRNEIKSLFEEVFDTYIFATFDEQGDSKKDAITEFYVSTYVPEGYKLVNEVTSPIQVLYRYENAQGKKIKLEQYLLNGVKHRFDNENETTDKIKVENYTVYYRISEKSHNYVWNDGKYTIVLISDEQIEKEELIKIVNGFQIKK